MHRSKLASAIGLAAAVTVVVACGGPEASVGPTPAVAATPSVAPPTAPATEIPVTSDTAASPVAITLTVEDDACRYDGPSSIPYGAYDVTFDVRDTGSLDYGWFVFTLAPGRTVDDVWAWARTDTTGEDAGAPDWVTILTIHPWETTGVAKVASENLRHMGAYKGGPIYLMCARPDRVLDIFGPIEVVQ